MPESRADVMFRRLGRDDLARLVQASTAILLLFETDGHGFRPTWVCPGIEPILGWPPDLVLERPGWWRDNIDPAHAEAAENALRAAGETGAQSVEFRFLNGVGDYRWIRAMANTIPGQPGRLSVTWLDITDARELQSALLGSEARLRSIFDNSLSALSLKGLDGRFELVNARWLDWTGMTEQMVIGKQAADFFPKTIARRVEIMHAAVIEHGQPVQDQFDLSQTCDQTRILSIIEFPVLDNQGRLQGIGGTATDITKIVAMQQELEESRRRFQDFAEASSDWMWELDSDLRFTYVSDAFVDVSNLPSGQVIGRSKFDVYAHAVGSDDPQERQAWEAHRQALAAHLPFRDFLQRWSASDGSTRWFLNSGKPIFDSDGAFVGYRGSASDITSRIESQRRLEISERRYRDLVNTAVQGIVISDHDGRPLFVNQAAARLFGFCNEAEMLALPSIASLFCSREEYQRLAGPLPEAPSEDAVDAIHEIEGCRIDGGRVWLLNHAKTIEWDGQAATQSTFVDISARKHAEERLHQQQKMEALGRLVGGVAHEFNNMLTVILSNLELLSEDANGEPEALRSVELVRSAASRGRQLTADLLAFARKKPISPTGLDARLMVERLEQVLQRTLDPATMIELHCPPEPCWVSVDPNQFESAILNLALNGRDAMPGGGVLGLGVKAMAATAPIAVEGGELPPGNYVRVCVSDTGTGLNAEARKRAFEPFFSTKPAGRGTGLGLSMVYGFAQQSLGGIQLENRRKKGTRACLYLPLAGPPPEVAEAGNIAEYGQTSQAGRRRILIVEDDPAVRSSLARILRHLAWDVVEAGDGTDALACLENDRSLDLVLSDIVMPGPLDGIELLRRIRTLRPELPTALMTGHSTRNFASIAELLPGVTVIQKPFDSAQLADTLARLLEA